MTQVLGLVPRLVAPLLAGDKTSTIRWREPRIAPGPMRYVVEGAEVARVEVRRCTDMPLRDVPRFLGRERDWPPETLLAGMRAFYPEITLDAVVQVVEHDPPAAAKP